MQIIQLSTRWRKWKGNFHNYKNKRTNKHKKNHYLARRTQSTFFIFPNIRASDGCLNKDQDSLYIYTQTSLSRQYNISQLKQGITQIESNIYTTSPGERIHKIQLTFPYGVST